MNHFSVEPLLAKRKGGRDGMYWPRLLLWYPGTVALREQAMAHQSLVALSLPAKQLLLSYFQPFLSENLDSRSQILEIYLTNAKYCNNMSYCQT